MAMITLTNQRIFYTQPQKSAGGATLLLVHGAGGSHLDWPVEIQRLPHTAVYNLDLPGHGRSDGPGHASIDAYTDAVAEFIDALALERVVVVGHSMGGAIAQTLGLRRLPRLVGLVLVGASARLRVADAILVGILPRFADTVDLITRFAWGPDAPAPLVARSRERMLATDPAVFHSDFLACDAFDVRAQVAQIGLPTLVISGAEDKMTPLKHGRFLAEQIPQATLVTLDGAGHYLPLEQPQAVAAAITQFLEAAGDA